MKWILALILVGARFCNAATTYFVSSSGGSDANNGTSSGTPWQTLSNVCSRSFSSGDTISLKSGEAFNGPITVTTPVIIGSYGGSVKPVIYGDHPEVQWFPVAGRNGVFSNAISWVSGKSNTQLVYGTNGTFYTNNGNQLGANLTLWLNTVESNPPPCWGASTTLNTVYVHTSDSNAPTQLHLFDFNVCRAMGGNSVISDIEVCNGANGIHAEKGSNVISNNFVHDCSGAGIGLVSAWNSEVVSNTVSTNGYTCIYLIQPGGSHWAHGNTLNNTTLTICGNVVLSGNPDTSGFGLLGGTNNLVELNTIRFMRQGFFDYFFEANTEVRFNYGFHAATAASPGGTGLTFHHNILDMDDAGGGIIGSHYFSLANQLPFDTGPVLIYNNTVYNFNAYGASSVSNAIPSTAAGVVYRNNIFQTTTVFAGGSMGIVGTGGDSDYNAWYSPNKSPRWKIDVASTLYTTLAALYAASGQEQHSLYTNSQFVAASPTNAPDFKISSASPDVRAGQFVAAGNDYAGFPTANPPSIGAFDTTATS